MEVDECWALGRITPPYCLCNLRWYLLIGQTDDGHVPKNQFLDSLMSNWC